MSRPSSDPTSKATAALCQHLPHRDGLGAVHLCTLELLHNTSEAPAGLARAGHGNGREGAGPCAAKGVPGVGLVARWPLWWCVLSGVCGDRSHAGGREASDGARQPPSRPGPSRGPSEGERRGDFCLASGAPEPITARRR